MTKPERDSLRRLMAIHIAVPHDNYCGANAMIVMKLLDDYELLLRASRCISEETGVCLICDRRIGHEEGCLVAE